MVGGGLEGGEAMVSFEGGVGLGGLGDEAGEVVYTNLRVVILGRRALHGRAWRRTRSPLSPNDA